MAVKLRFGDPVVIACGPTYEEVGWGPYQFPGISRLDDGRLVANFSVSDDTKEAYGSEAGRAISSDNGKTWSPISAEDLPAIKRCAGMKLPSGKRLRSCVQRPAPISDELHAELTRKMGRRKNCLGMEDIPDGIIEKFKWHMAIYDPETDTDETFLADVQWEGMTTSLAKGSIVHPMPFSPAHIAPDGSIWQSHYWTGRNPYNFGYTSYYACYYFQSKDEGRSYQLKSWIQYLPDTNDFSEAFTTEGFCEPDFCFMPDGSIITVMRTGSYTPSYIARSTDGGESWSRPVRFDRCGVLPKLLHLDCGVTLCSYGRPGLYVRATEDPSGQVWDEPCELMPYIEDRSQVFRQSCYYTSMLALDERTALLLYSDFNTDDGTGRKCKAICCRTVTVE